MTLTDRDYEILNALTRCVRVFSFEQISRTWWPSCTGARRRLKQLADASFIEIYTALSHPELRLNQPLAEWRAEMESPPMASVAYQLQTRWTQPPILTTFFLATPIAGRFLGGHGGRRSREKEQTHDLHLSAVFLHYRKLNPAYATHWRSEAQLVADRTSKLEKLPDAVIEMDSGPKVIEFGGSYPRPKLERFHEYWAERSTPYEIW